MSDASIQSDHALHAAEILLGLDRVNTVYQDARRRGVTLSLRAIAHLVRAASPQATALVLEDSDQGPYLTAVSVFDGHSEIPVDVDRFVEDSPADHRALISELWSLTSNLADQDRYAWEPFIEPSTLGQPRKHLDLGLVLAYAGDADRIRGHATATPIPLQIPAGQMFVWFGQPPVGDEQVLFVLTAGADEQTPMMRPLMAQQRDFAEGLREHAEGAAEHLGMTAVLREFTMFQVIDTVAP
jgi:hypothetical protein